MEAKTGPRQNNFAYILTYLIPLLSGLLVYFTVGQKEHSLKFHAVQSIIIGVVIIVAALVPIVGWIFAALAWIFGLVLGWQASEGNDAEVPGLSQFARRYSK